LDLNASGLTVTGSNSDMAIQTFIEAVANENQVVDIHTVGSIVLPARIFHEIMRKLPEDEVDFTVNDHYQTHIQSGKSEFHVLGLDATEYPLLPELKEEYRFDLKANVLKSVIRETVFAVSTSESRPILTGVHWQINNDELICVATDSHRLAKRMIKLDHNVEGTCSAVIPGKSLSELSKLIGDETERIQISITSQQILFKTSNVLFYSRLIEGNFPDTSRLIPNEYQTTVTMNGKSLFQAIDRASLLAREERNNIVQVKSKKENMVEVSSNSPEVGKVQEEIQTTSVIGEELKVSFSAKYMMDALKSLEGKEVTIEFTGPMRPFILKPVNNEAILQLIVPVRTY
ncbi:MAG: DNA polymerase III subunit beta, partial [Melioribacteraceae bacterium]|nr:DNA polymerase III subunit beta [Melioribacteraceae bacterium]